jgi:BED zinc finger
VFLTVYQCILPPLYTIYISMDITSQSSVSSQPALDLLYSKSPPPLIYTYLGRRYQLVDIALVKRLGSHQSKIWKLGQLYTIEGSTERAWLCGYCDTFISGHKNTSNAVRHLRKQHKIIINEVKANSVNIQSDGEGIEGGQGEDNRVRRQQTLIRYLGIDKCQLSGRTGYRMNSGRLWRWSPDKESLCYSLKFTESFYFVASYLGTLPSIYT